MTQKSEIVPSGSHMEHLGGGGYHAVTPSSSRLIGDDMKNGEGGGGLSKLHTNPFK